MQSSKMQVARQWYAASHTQNQTPRNAEYLWTTGRKYAGPRWVSTPSLDTCIGELTKIGAVHRGRALLVYWHHLDGTCCGLLHAWCPGLMKVQRPGSGLPVVARVGVLSGLLLWCCWPGLVG